MADDHTVKRGPRAKALSGSLISPEGNDMGGKYDPQAGHPPMDGLPTSEYKGLTPGINGSASAPEHTTPFKLGGT